MKLDRNTYNTKFGLEMFFCMDDTKEGGPMMWVWFAMDGNKQKRKWLIVECRALKWVNMNSAPLKGSH
jgi:hypothetical protein